MNNILRQIKLNKKGDVLLITLMILTSVLVVVLGVASLIIPSVLMNRTQSYSMKAYFASETGAERSLWVLRKANLDCTINNQCIDFSSNSCIDCANLNSVNLLNNGSSYFVEFASSTLINFQSSGVYSGTKRRIEISVGEPVCLPDCSGKFCGDDGCGGVCSPGCSGSDVCNNGVCTSFYQDMILSIPNIVAYWPMNGGWNDIVNNNNGTAYGDVSFSASSVIGSYAGSFDGNGDYVQKDDLSETLNLSNNAMSFEFWIKPFSLSSPSTLLVFGQYTTPVTSNTNDFVQFTLNTDGSLRYRLYEEDCCQQRHDEYWTTAANTIPVGTWTHVVVTHLNKIDGSPQDPKFYINGVSVGRTYTMNLDTGYGVNKSRTIQTAYDYMRIGADVYTSPSGFYKGLIDEIAVYNTELSSEQILEHYGYCGDACGPCVPICSTKIVCGDDGCGGSCGSCVGGTMCVSGECKSASIDKTCTITDRHTWYNSQSDRCSEYCAGLGYSVFTYYCSNIFNGSANLYYDFNWSGCFLNTLGGSLSSNGVICQVNSSQRCKCY